MSYFDDASLVMIPSGYKDQKVYSVKPLDGTGDLTFSRASNATRVNASGLIETVSSGVPRLDYTNSSCPKILLEPQRSNLALDSEQFNAVNWGSSAVGTVTANTTISPDGTQNADTYVEPGNGNYLFQAATSSSGTFTVSVFAKKGSSTNVGIGLVAGGFTSGMSVQFNFDTQTFATPTNHGNFTSISATSQSYGNGWYRLALTGTTASATTYYIVLGSLVGSAYAANVRLWGAQCEVGAYATSYIPTLGASVTRVADSAVKTSATALIGQTEGTIFMDAVIDAFPTDNSFFGVDKTASNFVIRFGSTGSNIYAQCYNGSANLFFQSTSYTLGERVKLAFAYKAGSYAFYKNGTLVATGTDATAIPACDRIMTNSLWGTVGNGKHGISQALLFKTRLTNAQLAELTTL